MDEKRTAELRARTQEILDRQEQMLLLFSGDARLSYVPEERGDTFVLLPREKQVLVPLYLADQYSESELLWHLYETLALYPDWQRQPDRYLERERTFLPEAEEITGYFLEKVRSAGLSDDPAYAPEAVLESARQGIVRFLTGMDRYAAVLTVQALAPVYAGERERRRIGEMLLGEGLLPLLEEPGKAHEALAGSFLTAEFYEPDDVVSDRVRAALTAPVLGRERFSLVQGSLRQMIVRRQGIETRDPFVRTFVLPAFLSLWKEGIDAMKLWRTLEQEGEQSGERRRNARVQKSPEQRPGDRKRALQELEQERRSQQKSLRAMLEPQEDLQGFGVSGEDLRIYHEYEGKVRAERAQMRQFWRRLIGEASRDAEVRLQRQSAGQLDVPVLIHDWPAFEEAGRQGSYKGLGIWSSYEYERRLRQLPQQLDITFVVDNSGSMRSGKVPAARQALAIVLLSLQDFAGYLRSSAAQTHQKIEVRTQVWLYGTDCRCVLDFADRGRKRTAGTVLSISRLAGTDGSTDDGKCLRAVEKGITPGQVREMAAGRRIHLLFVVTDGASSFPGSAKKAAEKLAKKGVHLQAIEIGRADDEQARRIFSYVYGEDGIFLGNHPERLPQVLMRSVASGVHGAILGRGQERE